jgi:hypothetical protein
LKGLFFIGLRTKPLSIDIYTVYAYDARFVPYLGHEFRVIEQFNVLRFYDVREEKRIQGYIKLTKNELCDEG